jgi:hypothetical protein
MAGSATKQHSLLESSHGPCSRKGARRARRSDARAVAKAQLAPWSAVAAEPSCPVGSREVLADGLRPLVGPARRRLDAGVDRSPRAAR